MIIGLQPHSLGEFCQCLVEAPEVAQAVGTVVVGLRELGPEAQRLGITRQRFLQPPLPPASNAQVVVGIGEIGPQSQYPPQAVGGLVQRTFLEEGEREIVQGFGALRA